MLLVEPPVIQSKRYLADSGEWEVTDSDGIHYYGATLDSALRQYAEAAAHFTCFVRHDPISAQIIREGRNGRQ